MGRVKVTWLPGYEPGESPYLRAEAERRGRKRGAREAPSPEPPKTKLPFEATIVGHPKGPYRVRVHEVGMEFLGWEDR